MADALNVKKMKVAELKKELELHGLEIKGNKSELQSRLKEFLLQQGLDLEHQEEGDEHDVHDELDHEEAEDLLADETLEQKTDMPTASTEEETKEPTAGDENQNGAPESPVKKTMSLKDSLEKPSTEEERRLQRMKRFGGAANEDDKKLARAQRFGTGTGGSTLSPLPTDLSKLKKRAERFGAVSPIVTKVDEQDKLMKRKARFGTSLGAGADDSLEAKKKKRAERFKS